jgi:hypothetical protein
MMAPIASRGAWADGLRSGGHAMDFSEIRDDEDEREEVPVKRTGCLLGLVRLLLVLLIPLFILLALAPTLMSSDPAREWALKKINAAIAPATLAIDGWSFGWLSLPH